MKQIVVAACLLVGLNACSSGSEEHAKASGVLESLEAGSRNRVALKSPMFESMADEMERSTGLPPPPAALPPVISAPVPRQNAPAWAADTLDATSFESLQASQSATLAKMEPEAAQIYDQAVKYLLIQVAADPGVIQAASSGGTPSDVQLMRSVKRILHGKTPSQIVLEAQELSERLENEGS